VPCRSAHAVQEPAKERGAQAADAPQVRHGTQRQLHPAGGVQPLPGQYKPGSGTSWILNQVEVLSVYLKTGSSHFPDKINQVAALPRYLLYKQVAATSLTI
jgi:hypothetical protein